MRNLLLFSCEPREPIFLLAFEPRVALSLHSLWQHLQPLPPENPRSGSLLLQHEKGEPSAMVWMGKADTGEAEARGWQVPGLGT